MKLRPALVFGSTVLAALLLSACSQQEAAPAAPAAAPAPAVTITASEPVAAAANPATYQDLQGNPVEISDYAGKKVFVNYWATWCAPCIKEIPSIARAGETLAAENFVFLLASDEKLDTIKDFLLDRGFSGNFIKMNSYVGSLGIDVMPTSVLYDEKGMIVGSWPGSFEWDSPEMLSQLRGQQ